MIEFKKLFSFKKREIDQAFNKAKFKAKRLGFKLLQAVPEQAQPNQMPNHGKLLIIISRASGKAHDRNKIRRQIKAIFYEEKLYQKPIASILIVYKEAMQLSFDEIKTFLKETI